MHPRQVTSTLKGTHTIYSHTHTNGQFRVSNHPKYAWFWTVGGKLEKVKLKKQSWGDHTDFRQKVHGSDWETFLLWGINAFHHPTMLTWYLLDLEFKGRKRTTKRNNAHLQRHVAEAVVLWRTHWRISVGSERCIFERLHRIVVYPSHISPAAIAQPARTTFHKSVPTS